jgi:hypothetical protein
MAIADSCPLRIKPFDLFWSSPLHATPPIVVDHKVNTDRMR